MESAAVAAAANAFAAGLSTTTIDIRLERRDAGIYQRSVGVAIDAPPLQSSIFAFCGIDLLGVSEQVLGSCLGLR
jgi:hypothetical protein